MHKYLYKKADSEICKLLREEFDRGNIYTEENFVRRCREYKPYKFIENELTFIQEVFKLVSY